MNLIFQKRVPWDQLHLDQRYLLLLFLCRSCKMAANEVLSLQEQKTQNFIKGAAILAATSIFVKILGAVYKIPLFNILGDVGKGSFQVTYSVYTLILNIATAGIPVALSRMVSSAAATGKTNLVKRYFKVAMPAFILIGVAAMSLMLLFANQLAGAMNNSLAAPGIMVLAPAVFFVCVISVYRGYAQGFENMIPTAASQALEVVCKAAFGIAITLFMSRAGYAVAHVSAGGILGVTIGLGLCIPLLARYKKKIDRGIVPDSDLTGLPGRMRVFGQLMKVSIPVTIGASFMSIITVIDNSVVLGRLQNGLGLSELDASAQFGIFAEGLTLYNLPSALIVPVAVSLVPGIAAALAIGRGSEAKSIMQSSVKLVNLFAMPASAGLMVLATPIMITLFEDSRRVAANVLIYLGAAAFFVCLQLVTTAILQANGNERLPLLTIPIGGVVKIAIGYFLVGNPKFGIVGSSIGSLACFIVICALNIILIKVKVKEQPKFGSVFIKPLLCTVVMAVAAFFVYELIYRVCAGSVGTGRIAIAAYLAVAIVIAVAVYGILIILSRTVTMDDMMLVPKGEKLAKILRIR